MGAYYRDVVVVIELGAYIHGVLTFNGCLLSRFYGISVKNGVLLLHHRAFRNSGVSRLLSMRTH